MAQSRDDAYPLSFYSPQGYHHEKGGSFAWEAKLQKLQETLNIVTRLRAHRDQSPNRDALIVASGQSQTRQKKTFRQLDEESDAYARGLQKLGIRQGTKTIFMVKPGLDLFTVLFALFKIGAVPVVVDPGMGIVRMLQCYRSVGAEALIGIPLAHWVRIVFRRTFSGVKTPVRLGGHFLWWIPDLSLIAEGGETPFSIAPTLPSELLMINFTTGSTGPPKGVEYTHGMADAMIRQVMSQFEQGTESTSLATLPLFGIFDVLIGSTSVLPAMDPTRPAKINPRRMIETISFHRITHLFASPAFLSRITEYGKSHPVHLASIRHVLSGGAPVSFALLESLQRLLPTTARVHAAYGATEALPIAAVSQVGHGLQIFEGLRVRSEAGEGSCVGMAVAGVSLRVIQVRDCALPQWSDELAVGPGETGEILVAGPGVSQRYHRNSWAQAAMKILDGSVVWHRTGDLGWVDAEGRIWFCGRKSQRVRTREGILYTVQWEGVFNAHPAVARSALVGVGPLDNQQPVLCVELRHWGSAKFRNQVESELLMMAARRSMPGEIKIAMLPTILFHRSFPVDIRHNAKINRETLARWAEKRLVYRSALRWFSQRGVSGVQIDS